MSSKILPLDVLIQKLDRVRGSKKIVFTNGCFDVLHAGHIDLLSRAKLLGDILVVGLNSDYSIVQNKGPKRPINNQDYRAFVLNYITPVDYIIGFDELTPIKLIEVIRPHILVKGGDYDMDNIVGTELLESYGGKVIIVPFNFDISSTKIINNVLSQYSN